LISPARPSVFLLTTSQTLSKHDIKEDNHEETTPLDKGLFRRFYY
jgi:hypothetical protein